MSKINYHDNEEEDIVFFEKNRKPSKQKKTDDNGMPSIPKTKKKSNNFRETIRGKNYEDLF